MAELKLKEAKEAKRYIKIGTAVAVISICLLVMAAIIMLPKEKAVDYKAARAAETVKAEEFSLIVGKEVPTVEVGSGTRHRLWSNKPYTAVSVQLDGSRILYDMPAGWESWTGAEPMGRLRLIGKKEGTIVRILG